MRTALAVASLEMSRRITLLPAALAVGLLPFAVSPLVGGGPEATLVMGVVSAMTLILVLSLVLGASVIGGDLAAGRLSFLFSRPIRASAIFAGKMLAAAVLVLMGGALAVLPSMFVHGSALRRHSATDPPVLFAVILTLFALGAAHLVGLALRARSPWLVLDLALLLLGAWVLRVVLRRLLALRVLRPWTEDPHPVLLLAALVALALLAAGLVQVVRGRTDLVQGHRAASLTFWPLFLLIPANLGLHLRWLEAATPRDLTRTDWIEPAPTGDWVRLAGPARGGVYASFFLDTRSGAHRPLEGPVGPVRFSADGTRAFWLSYRDGTESGLLASASLRPTGAADQRVILSPALASWWPYHFGVSPGGERVLFSDSTISVYDARTGIREVVVPTGHSVLATSFVDHSRVRAYRATPRGVEILEVALPSGRTEVVGRVDLALELPTPLRVRGPRLRFDADGARLLLLTGHPGRAFVADALRGGPSLELASAPGPTAVDATFLQGGSIAVVEKDGERACLRLFAPEGRPEGAIALPPAREIALAGAGPGRALVSLRDFGGEEARLVVVDTAERRVAATERGLAFTDEFLRFPSPGSRAVLLRSRSGLVRYDAGSGERTVVWAGPAGTGPSTP